MMIAGDKFGQLANRLFKFGHLIACSTENNIRLIFPHFEDYKHLFPNIQNEKNFDICFHHNRHMNKVILWMFSFFNHFTKYVVKRSYWHENIIGTNLEINLSDPVIKPKLKKKIVILNGWNIRDRTNFNKHAEEIKRIFSPTGIHKSNIDLFISGLHDKYDFLVGVHIRLGDYKNWLGGKYYYPIGFYANKCREILHQLKQLNKKVVFILCSDGDVDLACFEGLDCQKSTGHIIEDLYILSRGNLILGPPSTYSMWASFNGSVPLCHLYDKDQVLLLNQFKIHSE